MRVRHCKCMLDTNQLLVQTPWLHRMVFVVPDVVRHGCMVISTSLS